MFGAFRRSSYWTATRDSLIALNNLGAIPHSTAASVSRLFGRSADGLCPSPASVKALPFHVADGVGVAGCLPWFQHAGAPMQVIREPGGSTRRKRGKRQPVARPRRPSTPERDAWHALCILPIIYLAPQPASILPRGRTSSTLKLIDLGSGHQTYHRRHRPHRACPRNGRRTRIPVLHEPDRRAAPASAGQHAPERAARGRCALERRARQHSQCVRHGRAESSTRRSAAAKRAGRSVGRDCFPGRCDPDRRLPQPAPGLRAEAGAGRSVRAAKRRGAYHLRNLVTQIADGPPIRPGGSDPALRGEVADLDIRAQIAELRNCYACMCSPTRSRVRPCRVPLPRSMRRRGGSPKRCVRRSRACPNRSACCSRRSAGLPSWQSRSTCCRPHNASRR